MAQEDVNLWRQLTFSIYFLSIDFTNLSKTSTQCCRSLIYCDPATTELGEEDVNLYYGINTDNIPEAFSDFYKGSLTEDGGCKGLQVCCPDQPSCLQQHCNTKRPRQCT